MWKINVLKIRELKLVNVKRIFLPLTGLDQHQSVHGGQGRGGHPEPEGHLKVLGLVPRQQVQTPQDEINPRVQRQTSGRTGFFLDVGTKTQ